MPRAKTKTIGKKKPASRGTTSIDHVIGERIRATRLHAGLSQEELGDALGVSFQQVQKYEKGTNRVAPSRLIEIARRLNVSMDLFFDKTDVKRTPEKIALDKFMATREAVQIIDVMMRLPQERQQTVINVARSLAGAPGRST